MRPSSRPLGQVNENRPAPKKKVKPSSLCLTPPAYIHDKQGQSYRRGLCIGEGGFARCFQVNDGNGELYAAKTLAKSALREEKTRKKLIWEIKIHRALRHPNIVQFVDCFEDTTNVYILLEMCSNKSLMEVVKQRKRLTEPEARFWLLQILGGIKHMHSRLIVHRDLKLGNIFIDDNMNLKIGDFGLAACLVGESDRRKTVCGTPNYISPEILCSPHFHSFPTDLWAVGIIMYAMLWGNPPFQEKDVKVIYKRIKEMDWGFDSTIPVSDDAKDLVSMLLRSDPNERPTIAEILDHKWFYSGPFPSSIPNSALKTVPRLSVTPEDSKVNLLAAKVASGLSLIEHTEPVEGVSAAEVSGSTRRILPQSISPQGTRDKYRMIVVPGAETPQVPEYDSPVVERLRRRGDDRENYEPIRAQRTSTAAGSMEQNYRVPLQTNSRAMQPPTYQGAQMEIDVGSIVSQSLTDTKLTLMRSLRSFSLGAFSSTQSYPTLKAAKYVTKWADFDDTWGLAYGLTDGGVGIKFRDDTSMRMDPLFDTYVYFEPSRRNRDKFLRYPTSRRTTHPSRHKKVEVCRFVWRYMEQRLGQASVPARVPGDCSDGVFIHSFSRSDEWIRFVLSDGTIQFNFKDHNKVVLGDKGRKITLITDDRQEVTWPLEEALYHSRMPQNARFNLSAKFQEICDVL